MLITIFKLFTIVNKIHYFCLNKFIIQMSIFYTENPIQDAQDWINYLDSLPDNTTTENCADCDEPKEEFEQDGSPALHTQLISIKSKDKVFERKIKICTKCKEQLINSGVKNLKFLD